MQVGFIGTGNMGSVLIRSLITSRALTPDQIVAYNRTPSKAALLSEEFPGLIVGENNVDVVHKSLFLFLCMKPFEYRQVLEQIKLHLTTQHTIITITSPIHLSDIERFVPCPVARIVPSITNAAKSGVTLVEFGSRVTEEIKRQLLSLASSISQPLEIQPANLRIASDISSCGPAFISYFLQQMIFSAVENYRISEDAATYLTTEMIIGMADLLKRGIFSLPALQERVCVPGGITGEGLSALKEQIPGLFQEVFRRTHAKFSDDTVEMHEHLFGNPHRESEPLR